MVCSRPHIHTKDFEKEAAAADGMLRGEHTFQANPLSLHTHFRNGCSNRKFTTTLLCAMCPCSFSVMETPSLTGANAPPLCLTEVGWGSILTYYSKWMLLVEVVSGFRGNSHVPSIPPADGESGESYKTDHQDSGS